MDRSLRLPGRRLAPPGVALVTAAALLVVACASSDHAGHGNGPTQGSPQPADAYVWISGQRLHFWDFGHADNALVLDGSGLTVTITDRGALGMAAGNGCANTAPHEVQCSAAGITLFILEMGSGSDTAENRVPVDGQMYGGEGDDTLLGGPGDQQLNGGAGHDILSGGSGDDLLEGGVGGDVLNGGSGSDTASYGERTSAVIAHIGGTDEGETLEHDTIGHDVENVVGGSGDDALYGNNDANVLRGMAGVDELYGGGGIDSVDGGDDADLVDGGNDGIVDIVIGGDGIDSCAWPQDSISQCEAPAKLPFRR